MDSLTYLAPLVVVPLLLRWLLRGRRSEAQRVGEGTYVMGYGPAWRAGVWVGVAFVAVLAALPLFVPVKPDERGLMLALPLGFGALVAVLALEVFRLRFHLTPEGIERHSPWRRTVLRLRWGELRAVVYLPGAQALELCGPRGERMRLSQYLQGFGTLADHLARHAPPALAATPALAQVRALG